MRHTILAILTAMLVIGSAGCGGEATPSNAPSAEARGADGTPPSPQDAAQQAMQHAQQAQNDPDAKPVEPEALRALLPSSAAGLPKVDEATQNVGMMGMQMATVSAEYEKGTQHVTLTITDTGTLRGTTAQAAAAWTLMDIDRTTADGYERTTKIRGYKAMERLQREAGVLKAEVALLVADRFIVEVKGRGLEMEPVKDILNQINLRRLAGMG